MRGCKPALKQHSHGIAFVAHRWLDPDQHIAKGLAEHKQVLTVGPFLARCRPPLCLDLSEPGLRPHVVIHGHALIHIRLGAKLFSVALEDRVAECGVGIRKVDPVPFGPHRRQRVVERLEHAEVRRGACRAAVWRKVKQDDGHFSLRNGRVSQSNQPCNAVRQTIDALWRRLHVKFFARGAFRATAKHHRPCRAIELRNRDHHSRLNGHQTHGRGFPVLQTLKLKTLHRQIRHIEGLEHFLRGVCIVVRGATNQ